MILHAFRVCRASHAVLDGEGAKRVGGRWNSPGRAAVYLAGSVSLAVLENLVHMSPQDFPKGYVVVEVRIPSTVTISAGDELARRFSRLTTQQLGDQWLELGETAVLRVRSTVVPQECNYVLNPLHRQFKQIETLAPVLFQFDERLFRA